MGASPRLLLLLGAYVLTALAWGGIVPPYENLDELEHFEVIRYIARNGRLPIHSTAEAEGYHVRQEASQPPLYHILGAIWLQGWHLSTAAPYLRPYPASLVSCGQSLPPYNKSKWVHTQAERFPWQGPLLTLHSLRLLSTLLQVATLLGVWTFARRVSLHGPVLWLTLGIVAFNPQFLLVASGVNNDNLITPLATWGWVVAFDLWDRGPTPGRATLFGLLSGLAALSKLSGIGLLALGELALFIRVLQGRTSLTEGLKWGMWMGAPVVCLLAPWLMRNLYLYGDPTALRPMLEIVGRRATTIHLWGDIFLTLRSYWGQLPCVFYPRAVYWPYYSLVLGGMAGLIRHWRKYPPRQQMALGLAILWLTIIVSAWIRWDHITPAPGGRLWFPASGAAALLIAEGWLAWTRWGARIWAAGLPLFSLIVLWLGPVRTYAPVTTLPPKSPVPNLTNIEFGDQITLRGYQAQIKPPTPICVLLSDEACHPALDVTFYWQAIQPRRDPVLALQLRSPNPQDTTLRFNYNHWPAHGNLPPSAWPTKVLFRDHYILPLPPVDKPTQAWRLTLAYFDRTSGERLPVQINGITVGDSAELALLRVPDHPPPLPNWRNPHTPVEFGNAITLQDAQVTAISDTWRVSLVWESTAPLPEDYTVFVHALADKPTPAATGDGPPMNGQFPTSVWERGDRIYDQHSFTMPTGLTPTRIIVGWYCPQDGMRLPARRHTQVLPNNAALIWPLIDK